MLIFQIFRLSSLFIFALISISIALSLSVPFARMFLHDFAPRFLSRIIYSFSALYLQNI